VENIHGILNECSLEGACLGQHNHRPPRHVVRLTTLIEIASENPSLQRYCRSYKDLANKQETRRQYDSYPNPREETFFTQPQRFQSSSADRRSSGSVNEVSDKWTSSHYSPPPRSSNRGPSPILRRASPRDPVNWDRSRSPQGTRDAPIFIEDTPPVITPLKPT